MGHIPFTYFLLILLAWYEVLIALITDKMIIAEIINSYFTLSSKWHFTMKKIISFENIIFSYQSTWITLDFFPYVSECQLFI